MSEQNPRTPAPPENAPKGKKKMDSTIPKTTRATSASTRPRSKRQAAKKALTEKETAVTPPLVTETPQQEQTTSKPPTSEVLEEDFFMSTEDPDNQSQSTAPSSDHSHPPTSGSEPPSPMSEPESEDPPSWMEALPNGLLEGEPSPTPQKLDKGKSRALETSVEPEDVFNLEDKETEVPYTLMDKGKGKSITAPSPPPLPEK
ncbi:hypothetical protein NLI96_g10096 [Meripilus lineatus]|uniref:Uncharacterized protein n=1 Tax=Meripilus lineatus TaxID=2056292 RepID=A0AAD5UVR7_9APHY|nr:hypothetical protein NLI96_g10096 [Physisporinus lineatus]